MRALRQLGRSASSTLLLGRQHHQQQHHEQDDAEELQLDGSQEQQTPLDKTLTKIGFGSYQKKLLVLCGFGWLADNMWLQCVAVILPRVQDEWGISDNWIGMLSSSTFTGMMIGAWSWGSYSDSFGRVRAFNGTLLLTAFFGIAACFANSFTVLCFCFFGLGLGVGGSMPTDGTLFLENIPNEYHYLLTALSVFFSLGAMITSVIALIVIPTRSCQEDVKECDVAKENTGWRMILGILAGITLIFFCCRTLLFKLHESPRYLVTSGQKSEAVDVLRHIRDHNGDAFAIELADVHDRDNLEMRSKGSGQYERLQNGRIEEDDESAYRPGSTRDVEAAEGIKQTKDSKTSLRETVQDYFDRLSELLQSKLRKVTLLTWSLWFTASAAYTIFNVFMPKFLEEKLGSEAGTAGRVESLQEYCFYTFAGLPGSLVGAYLEQRVGKKEAMAMATLGTALGVLGFVFVSSQFAVLIATMCISFMATLMYAIIYSYTPRLFPVSFRGSATGIASALSRLAGMTAPIMTGVLLAFSTSLPLYIAAGLLLATAGCMLALP
ncbi:MFS general substrate transporter [Cystobasidium minutum MCA 4210]|uniref:MFS general substrate transporter n=1 Tax=Cystobasidium minutum MCA 4210 TaxID=1397322 RepID=UPI0034CED6A0|eukprot:jgi/Rhomi1/157000/estExt_Genewise1Plus.C_1_t20180